MRQTTDIFEDELLELYLEDSLLTYITMYFKAYYGPYNYGVYESKLFNESLGEFSRRTEISESIFDRITKTKSTKYDLDCHQYNTFFDRLHIDIKTDNIFKFAYIRQDFDNNTIFIELSLPKNIYVDILEYRSSCVALIGHELNHAYEDYNRHKNGVDTIDKIIDKGYSNATRYLFSSNNHIRQISRLIYFFNDQERNAYFSQLKDDVKNIIKKHNWSNRHIDYVSLIEELKQTNIWKEYFKLGAIVIALYKDKLSLKDRESIAYWYNTICKTNKSISEIKKDLYRKWLKFKKKFEQLVPKICTENIQLSYTFI